MARLAPVTALALAALAQAQQPVPVVDPADHVFCHWPTNFRPWPQWPGYQTVRHVHSGHYALSFDTAAGSIVRLGRPATLPATPAEGLHLENATIEALPDSGVTYSVTLDGTTHAATSFLGSGGNANIPGRLVDGGRFMQRLDVPEVGYAGAPGLAGSLVLAAMPRHFALTQRAVVPAGGATTAAVHLDLDGPALAGLTTTQVIASGRGLRMTDATGNGWVFLVPEVTGTTATLTLLPGGGIQATRIHGASAAGDPLEVSLIGLRTEGLSAAQLDAYVDPGANVQVRYAQQDRQGQLVEPLADAAFDPERGVYLVELDPLTNVGAPTWPTWSDPSHQTWYNRHRIVVESTAPEPVVVPLAFDLEADVIASITGGCAMLRDANGEPLGVPVQISKNWHETTSPRRWYHLYSAPLLPAGGTHELELTMTSGSWGSCFAASHAQLSLIGWGQDQQWDESALGCWGESITYDPDLTLQRSMLDDVRPFLVESQSQYNWTGNVGGGDFLTYWKPNGARDRLGRLRTHYAAPGPNLTDVTYAGETLGGQISATIRTRLGRTDDLVRAYYDLEYVFHEDVPYSRLALFQIAADNYSDNDFQNLAYGNASTVLHDAPANPMGTVGYASSADRAIPLAGEAPWVRLYDNQKQEALREDVADVGFVIRDYALGTPLTSTITTPYVNIVHTNNWGQYPEVGFELGVPILDPAAPMVPAGSVLRATIEYLVVPDDKALYYGPSTDLLAVPASTFGTPEMMRLLADENRQVVQPQVGVLNGTHPIDITCAPGATAAEFELTGGFGHVAMVFRDLDRHDGWVLQRHDGSAWVDLGQEVEGNDYWQCRYDGVAGSYELTFNVQNDGPTSYRLTGIDPSLGTRYCTPALANSSGLGGRIDLLGSPQLAVNDLTLAASQLPPNQFGMFVTSATVASIPVGSGLLCVGGQIGRFNAPGQVLQSGPGGSFDLLVDLTQNWPVVGVLTPAVGETWHFQAWFRDLGPTSNFTDALALTFN